MRIGNYPAITGVGMALPEQACNYGDVKNLFTNSSTPTEVQKAWDDRDQGWAEHIGIYERRILGPNEMLAPLGAIAASEAMDMAGIDPSEIQGVYAVSVMSDAPAPDMGSLICGELNRNGAQLASDVTTFELRGGCAGGGLAIDTATAFMQHYRQNKALVVAADAVSRGLEDTPPQTAGLFGDGAVALVMERVEDAVLPKFVKYTDPNNKILHLYGNQVYMEGGAVRDAVMMHVPPLVTRAAKMHGLYDGSQDQIDWSRIAQFVPHQANPRLARDIADAVGAPPDKSITTAAKMVGNLSAASMLGAIHYAQKERLLDSDNRPILATGMGAGFLAVAGAVTVRIPAI